MEKTRILLVDDHVVVRQGTRQLLDNVADFEVVGEADDGEIAVKLACELKPDIVIMDIVLPKLNGIEATKRIKAVLPKTLILVLSGFDYDEYILGLLEAGADGYLLKTVCGDDLINTIRAVKNGEPVLHPTIVRKLMNRFGSTTSTTHDSSRLDLLTERELEVLKLAAKAFRNKDIADKLFISTRTVQAHFRSIFAKLEVASRSEAVLYGLKKGWFAIDDIESMKKQDKNEDHIY